MPEVEPYYITGNRQMRFVLKHAPNPCVACGILAYIQTNGGYSHATAPELRGWTYFSQRIGRKHLRCGTEAIGENLRFLVATLVLEVQVTGWRYRNPVCWYRVRDKDEWQALFFVAHKSWQEVQDMPLDEE